jgi:hypothetical protein
LSLGGPAIVDVEHIPPDEDDAYARDYRPLLIIGNAWITSDVNLPDMLTQLNYGSSRAGDAFVHEGR